MSPNVCVEYELLNVQMSKASELNPLMLFYFYLLQHLKVQSGRLLLCSELLPVRNSLAIF
jgi:hypothetical protein